MSKSRRPTPRSLTKKPAPRLRTGKQARHYHSELKAKAVKQGLCRQCYKKRGKSPSSIRCAACHATHLKQAKKYRHDKVPQAVVKTRKARETKRVLKHTPRVTPLPKGFTKTPPPNRVDTVTGALVPAAV